MAKITCSSEANLANYLLILFTVLCLLASPSEAQQLPQEEVDALKEIATDLGIESSVWNFGLNPCNGDWNSTALSGEDSTVYCSPEFEDGVWHVVKINVKEKDLAGVLPPSMAKLQYLKSIDLGRNYLSGTIPKEWESLKLEYLDLLVNRLSGPLPDYLGNMANLTYLCLENNMFNGTIPATLGNLVNLEALILSANNLTGELPKELNNLSKLKDLRLSSNNFTGKLPAVHQWENLQRLELQASGFEGPPPPSISTLKNLTELRIGYFKGIASEFPSLANMTKMQRLILGSCNLSGIIPEDIAKMEPLKILDLSFNNLQGGVPDLKHLEDLEFVYLTGNSLSGPFPEWTRNTKDKLKIDLSYNNFSENSVPTALQDNLNLYRSFDRGNRQELAKNLASCSKDYYSVHINCGGKEVKVGDVTFEADEQSSGAAKLTSSNDRWGVSSTGAFVGTSDGTRTSHYTANNISILNINDSELFMTARRSGLSLTYYARCLVNGNYTVTLHFAEIILRNNRSFWSLGRRMFDIYIQDELKVEDFDIEMEAQGVDKSTKKPFEKVVVNNRTLEIRLQYAGKGTTAVPWRGSYGPLISAISVESEFPPPSNSNTKRKVIIAVVSAASGMLVILAALYFIWKKYYSSDKISREKELRGLDLQTGFFTYRQIRAATDDFSPANKIGEGGFGAVYKGILLDGTIIAVKQLSPKSKQGNREFVNEIGMISGLQHPNVVRLYGCCIEGNQLLLIYEYLENNSLAHALFGLHNSEVEMDWPTRQRICIGIAKGLAFLHDESALRIVHRDIKATNILLDKELNPKISDFGLAKLDEEENTHISTRVAGTIGYMAPEYALWGYLTYKADVYSFGVVALEIVAGKNNMSYRPSQEYVCLLDWALVLQKKGDLVELVDPRLGSNFNKEEAVRMIKVALLCANPSPALRPTMSAVVGMLEGGISSQEYTSDPSVYNDGLNFQGLKDKYDEMQLSGNETGPTVCSSDTTKSRDLYPLILDSQ